MSFLNISAFTSLHETISPDLLPETSLTQLVNGRLNAPGKAGKIVMRPALAPVLAASAPVHIGSFLSVTGKDGYRYYIIAGEGKLFVMNVKTGESRLLGTIDSFSPRLAAHPVGVGTFLLLVDGVPYWLGGEDCSQLLPFSLPVPDLSGVVSSYAPSGGNLSSGHYTYAFTFADATGAEGPPSRFFTHYMGNDLASSAAGGVIRIANLPQTDDARIVSLRIYRSNALTVQSRWFQLSLHSVLPVGSTILDDRLPDADLDSSVLLSIAKPPLLASSAVTHRGRLFLGNITISGDLPFAPELASSDPAPMPGFTSGNIFSAWRDTSGGGLLAGARYQWLCTFVDAAGRESAPVFTPPFTTNGPDEFRSVDLKLLPFCGAGGLAAPVTGRRLYRTKGDGNTFYLVADIGLTGNSYTDILQDSELVIPYNPDAPKDSYPCGIMFSTGGSPLSFPAENLIQPYPEAGAQINGLSADDTGMFVLRNSNILRMETNGAPVTWRASVLLPSVGLAKPEVFLQTGSGIILSQDDQILNINSGEAAQLLKSVKHQSDGLIRILSMRSEGCICFCYPDQLLIFDPGANAGWRYRFPLELIPSSDQLLTHFEAAYGNRIYAMSSAAEYDLINDIDFPINLEVTTAHFQAPPRMVWRIQRLLAFGDTAGARIRIVSGDGIVADGTGREIIPRSKRVKQFWVSVTGPFRSLERLHIFYKYKKMVYSDIMRGMEW